MAYRSRRQKKAPRPPEKGVVSDMVRQFADRYAFVRELVQNSIDAGASHVRVSVQVGSEGTVVSSVEDDGEGMTRATIEGPLLTLFSSSKDQATGKIGKYGVGFVSVFGLEPREVVVESWRPGESWVLRLSPDHRYELVEGRERAGSGTIVAIVQSLDFDELTSHAASVRNAMLRWCRHASIPLSFVRSTPSATSRELPSEPERIDRPLDVQAVVCVVDAKDGEQIVLGPSAGWDFAGDASEPVADSIPGRGQDAGSAPSEAMAGGGAGEPTTPAASRPADGLAAPPLEQSRSYGAFFNRGLTLFETGEPIRPSLEGIRFKVQSSRLQHTLSRDNVRRDAEYERLVDRVEDLVRSELGFQLRASLAEAAQHIREPGVAKRYVGLLVAACTTPTRLDLDELTVPVAHPVGQQATFALSELQELSDGHVFVSASPSPVTEALAKDHRPVLLAPYAIIALWVGHRIGASAVHWVDDSFSLVDEIAASTLSDSDRALCRVVSDALQQVGAPVARVGMASTRGRRPIHAVVALAPGVEARGMLLSVRDRSTWWPLWSRATDLLLLTSHQWVARARARAEHDALVAGHLLARALVVEERGPLSGRASGALLEAARLALGARAPQGTARRRGGKAPGSAPGSRRSR